VDELLVGTKGKIHCGTAKITDLKGNSQYQFDKKTDH
jgi:hypothetical protein